MRCNCESSYCERLPQNRKASHRAAHCQNEAAVPCDFVGAICEPCAEVMRATGGAEYLRPEWSSPPPWVSV